MKKIVCLFVLSSISFSIISQNTVFDVIANSSEYSLFKDMVLTVGADVFFQNDEDIILLAPYNDAIDSSFTAEELQTIMLNIDDALVDFVENHIVIADTFSYDFGAEHTTYYGSKFHVFIDNSGNHILGIVSGAYAHLDYLNERIIVLSTEYLMVQCKFLIKLLQK